MGPFTRIFLASAALMMTRVASAQAEPVEDFYRGRTINLIVGFPPGGGYDANVRVLSRHLGRFIPGEPTVTVSNMPGAGSLTAANYLYRSSPADGTVLGMFSSSSAMEPILGNKAATFDPLKFSWIGSMSQDVAFCGMWQGPGVPTRFDEMLKVESIIGGGGQAAITYQHPMVLKNVLGAKLNVVNGYAGTRDINLAMNRGEVNGSCGLFTSSIMSQWADEVKSGRLKLVVQMGAKKTDVFGDIPSVFDYARTDEQRAIMDVHFRQLLLARPLAGPPDIPKDRLDALRKAFFQTLDDPQFRAEAAKLGVEVDPVTPDRIEQFLKANSGISRELREKALSAMGR
jgi:tripartite-type tricarboxylate transporter receptor subunit TctC